MSARRNAAYGLLITLAVPAAAVVSIFVDLIRVRRNRGKWAR